MTVHLYKSKLSYFSVPKVACTSIKTALFEIENGFEFRDFHANDRYMHIHNAAYPTLSFDQVNHSFIVDHVRYAVVREPIARVVSCWVNRVVQWRELSEKEIGSMKKPLHLKFDPQLDEFILNLDEYRKISWSIKHHTEPLSFYLGLNASYFERIFSLRNLNEFALDCSKIIGRSLLLPRLQVGSNRNSMEISELSRTILTTMYAEDYRLFGRFF